MDDLQAARKRWQRDEPRYRELVTAASARLKGLLKERGLYAEVGGRTKGLDSLLKKLLRKPDHTYDTVSDKAGVRVMVRYTRDIAPVRSVIEEHFTILKIDDKAASLSPDQFKYQGIHYDAVLPENSAFSDLRIEIQLCTRAQNLWSDLSHDIAYKTVLDLPQQIHRQVNSLAALLEVVDREFHYIMEAIYAQPDAHALHVLTALERAFYRINPVTYARDLSVEVINALEGLYPLGTDLTGDRYDAFTSRNAAKLDHVLLQNSDRSPFLSQPEILLVFDLLELDEFSLQERWCECFPSDELEQLAILWGKPIP